MKEEQQKRLINAIMILIAFFSILLQIYAPNSAEERQTSILIFIGLIGYIGILYFILWAKEKVTDYTNQITQNSTAIDKLKETMELNKKFHQYDKRISILENQTNKKGQINIDPIWIMLLILLMIFYIYLKSLGVL